MLQLAGITALDTVYDLGCGDGRIVVLAAKKYGARGYGIDIDPQRITDAQENAKHAGMDHLVKFQKGDLKDGEVLGDDEGPEEVVPVAEDEENPVGGQYRGGDRHLPRRCGCAP